MQPIVVPHNIIDHFCGGVRIAELRGVDMPSTRPGAGWPATLSAGT